MNNELKYYNQKEIWERYDKSTVEINRARNVINLIPENVSTVLDIGCGNGIVTNMIKKPYVVGLDFAKIPLSQVKNDAIQGCIDALPIKNKKFDLIILTEVLEHLDDETYIKAIKEIRSLKPNYLLITVPYDENIKLGLCKCSVCGNLFNSCYHHRNFNDTWFYNEFSEYDLDKKELTSFRPPDNEKIVLLKQRFGAYLYSEVAICNKCGGRPVSPNLIIRYMFCGLNLLDSIKNKIFRNQKPYHQMILLKRRNLPNHL